MLIAALSEEGKEWKRREEGRRDEKRPVTGLGRSLRLAPPPGVDPLVVITSLTLGPMSPCTQPKSHGCSRLLFSPAYSRHGTPPRNQLAQELLLFSVGILLMFSGLAESGRVWQARQASPALGDAACHSSTKSMCTKFAA